MAAAVLGLPNAAELASTPAAAITDRICRVRYSVPPTRLGDTAVPLLICGFGVRVPGGAPGGLHISPGSMFTFGVCQVFGVTDLVGSSSGLRTGGRRR